MTRRVAYAEPADVFDHVYADLPDELRAQKEAVPRRRGAGTDAGEARD